MGSFFGHVLPGTFFIVCAIWWAIQTFRRYYISLQKGNKEPFLSTPTFPVHIGRRKVNIEAYVVIISCSLGMLVELVAATIKNHHLGIGNIQHGTMYFFFGMVAVSAVILPKLKVVPRYHDVIYIILTLAYVTEGLLFKFHLFGRTGVDVLLHTLLVYTIFATAVVVMLEMKYRSNVLLPLGRSFLTILQGTWFWQAAFVLYPPLTNPWGNNGGDENQEDHHKLMFLTCVYTWHMAVIFIVMTICGVFIGAYYKKRGGLDEEALISRHYNNDNPQLNGYTSLNQNGIQDDDL